ncbi:hypothetical protein ASPVEDRAFT_880601 [Aspergillus versicolor CBS 583.65]|uniref:F-box domain-containing protein n=1 Tax=Aspergillus versicolor CBS 583.65 TaxID=1036611 RepID=A0A1L9P9C2_ASPVE|nr:uncharacterized protein ASPVEDRAFT_880601 [Aspergillus versicolor CBS 583.65]OJI98085.1 hypothetical protein ASPVEDRAFT_880601 [Aspergillus versicolor CBS 583.65]
MLGQLPAEILFELDKNTLMNLYQLCRRFYSIADSQLREIYRTKTFSLNTDLTLSRSVDRRTLKFIKDLVFVPAFKDGRGLGCFRESIPGLALDDKRDNEVECALMPVFRGLRRDSLKNIEYLALKTTAWRKDHAKQHKLSISRFHKVRSLSWQGVCMVNHCIALAEFFQTNAHRLEELELSFGSQIYASLREWRDLQKDYTVARNAFVFKILQLDQGQTKTVFPKLKKLSLGHLHRLRALKLRESTAIVELLSTIATITSRVELISLDIELGSTSDLDTEAFQRFFGLSFPNLEDVFIHVDATDDRSTNLHWRSVLAHDRQINRFVYSRRHQVQGDTMSEAPMTPFNTTEALDGDILALPSVVNLKCVAICDNLSTLATRLSRTPALKWEILNIRSISEYTHGNPLSFEMINDMIASFCALFPGLSFNISRMHRFSPRELGSLLGFACWAFGPSGLPKLDLLVYGEVKDLSEPSFDYICLCRNTTALVGCVPFRVLEIDKSADGDVELRGKIKANAEFLETMPSSPWDPMH